MSDLAAPPPLLRPGQRIDRYVVEERIGEGGAATVYRVTHVHLGSSHALKVLAVADPELRRRLIEEGRSQARLRHPNVLAVTDAVRVDELPCLVMDFVDGPSLYDLLEDYTPTLDESLELFRGILRGVDAAHALGLVHRDLKPENVLLSLGDVGVVPKVADFGLVKVVDKSSGSPITRSGAFMGTPEYMAPEQMEDSAQVDARADLFSLGCLLYELVCGSLAFRGAGDYDLLQRVMAVDYRPPRELVPDLPDRVVDVIERLLVKDPDERLPDCAAIMAALYGDAESVRGDTDDEAVQARDAVVALRKEATEWIVARTAPPARRRSEPGGRAAPRSGRERAVEWVGVGVVAFLASVLGVVVGVLVMRSLGLL